MKRRFLDVVSRMRAELQIKRDKLLETDSNDGQNNTGFLFVSEDGDAM
jgi:hypothetical protein